jgi:hypothetical protein
MWTPTLAASLANSAAALPPWTSTRAGRSPGSKSASASVDGGRHFDAPDAIQVQGGRSLPLGGTARSAKGAHQ